MFLGLPGEERYTHCLRFLKLSGHLGQHGDAARNVEATDRNRQACGTELAGEVECARVLVRLDTDQTNHRSPALCLQVTNNALWPRPLVGLVACFDFEMDAGAQQVSLSRVISERIHTSECIGRHDRAEPLDRVAVIVVMGRLDEDERES